MIKAIVFDLDDTLYPEIEYVREGFVHLSYIINKKYGITDAINQLNLLNETDVKCVYNRFFEQNNVEYTQDDINILVENYRSYERKSIKFYDGVDNTLKELRSLGFRLGVITDGRINGQRNKINALNLSSYVDKIIITDSLGGESYRKPHAKSFKLMAKTLNVELEEMLYVGDNRAKDFAVKKELPIRTCEILRDDKIHKQLEYYLGIIPDYKIYDLSEILQIAELKHI